MEIVKEFKRNFYHFYCEKNFKTPQHILFRILRKSKSWGNFMIVLRKFQKILDN